MKHLLKIFIVAIFVLGFNESKANTLLDSLNSAYLKNPKLNAERASMRASREEKREAISEFLPSITISGYVSEQENTNPGDDTNFRPSEQSVTIEQKIFQGFGGVANLKKKKYEHNLGEFKLKKVEQEILLAAAEVHTDLLLSRKKVNINLMNIDLLERQVETDQNRLEKGEISLTDLAQSESSLAGATAQLIAAQNDLVTSRANFEKIIGKKSKLEKNLRKIIKRAEKKTKQNNKISVQLALNYGSQNEIINSLKNIIKKKQKITTKNFEQNLYTAGFPDPDILIRTGGKKRLSNFLLWQMAYTEIFFIDKMWPDFNKSDLKKILNKFRNIKRNFGKI